MTTLRMYLARGGQALKTLEMITLGVNIFIALAMMVVVVYGVVMRYIFNIPARWVAEVSEFMMVALSFLVLAYVQYQRKHINITFLIERRNEKTKTILGVITTMTTLIVFILLTWASWQFALKALRSGFSSDAAAIPLFPPRLLVPIGAFLMCLQLIADLIQGIASLIGVKVSSKA